MAANQIGLRKPDCSHNYFSSPIFFCFFGSEIAEWYIAAKHDLNP